jgi:signal transduction histidine kinase
MILDDAQSELRETGISLLGKMPWGTHLCHFYETNRDLLDAMVPYFKTGLESNEFCLWVVSDPLSEEEARSALRLAVPDLDQHLADRRMEIISHCEWYLKEGRFDLHRVIAGWDQKLEDALTRGFSGMRASGNTSWIQEEDWRAFREYEMLLGVLLEGKRMIVLCTYHLAATPAAQLLDVARIHQCAVARRCGHWEIVETPETKKAKREIEKLNVELEQRILDRTKDLEAANWELRDVSRRLMQVQEDERRHLARELHDEIGQMLTATKITLQSVQQSPASASFAAPLAQSVDSLDSLIGEVRRISLDLRPPLLDDLGLVPALRWYLDQTAKRSGLEIHFIAPDKPARLDSKIETACFRVVQEALTNVVRHAHARSVTVELGLDNGLTARVSDDGVGFDLEAVQQRARNGATLGLLGMQERAALLGGRISFQSDLGKGTEIRASFPASEHPP